MIGAPLEGLALLTPEVFLYVAIGILVCTLAAVTPGLGGLFALAVMLPFAFRLDPIAGIAMLMGVNVVSATGNTITSILFGIPGSASGVASTFDGYPMSQRGEGVRAVSAGLTASAVGGVLGAAVLALSLPFVRQIVVAFRPPEFLALILLALVLMAFVGERDAMKGLISGGLGLLISFVGMEASTATQRYTFGHLYMWEGFRLVPVVLGLFAITEMINAIQRGGSIAQQRSTIGWRWQMWQGVRDVFRHWTATVQSSAAGLWVGLAPGLGDSAAQFVGYGQVARTSKNREKFGTGTVEGVIAADAATNSKEGGALIPTLAFGIPGSSSMAIVIAAFIAFGIQPGPAMLNDHADMVWMIIWILVIANIGAAILCLGITPLIARLTELRASLIVPPILVASALGAYSTASHVGDLLTVLAFGFVGWVLQRFGYSRAIFLVAFVLGPLLERYYLLTMRTYGLPFVFRPLTMIFLAMMLVTIAAPVAKSILARRDRAQLERLSGTSKDPESQE